MCSFQFPEDLILGFLAILSHFPKPGSMPWPWDSMSAQRNQKPNPQSFFKSNVSFISVQVNGSHGVSTV